MSHSLTSPSSPPVASVAPSGANERARTIPLCPSRRPRSARVRTSQTRTSWSAPPEASRPFSPSGAKATARTEAECPANLAVSRPVTRFQIRTVLS